MGCIHVMAFYGLKDCFIMDPLFFTRIVLIFTGRAEFVCTYAPQVECFPVILVNGSRDRSLHWLGPQDIIFRLVPS